MVMMDRAGAVQHLNSAAEHLFGYSREALAGKPIKILVPDGLQQRHKRHREAFFEPPAARPMGKGRRLTAKRRRLESFFAMRVGCAASKREPRSGGERGSDRHAGERGDDIPIYSGCSTGSSRRPTMYHVQRRQGIKSYRLESLRTSKA